jgi:hypothetical protein
VSGRGASQVARGDRDTGQVPASAPPMPVDGPAAVARLRRRIVTLEADVALLRRHGVGTRRLEGDLATARRTYVLLVDLNATTGGGDHARLADR